MSESKKSFFSSIPGLITGLAGLLTGIVGLVTVLVQLDVIGGDDDAGPATAGVSTTVAGQAPGQAPAAGVTTTQAGRFVVEPATLKLQTTEREKSVTVRNTGASQITVQAPALSGADRSAFRTDSGCTNVALPPRASCTLKVSLTPSGPLKTYTAELEIGARETGQVVEVPIEATAVL